MMIILRENVENLGQIGDVVKVTDGYARNFILPRKLGVFADEKNIAAIEHHKRSLEKKRQAQVEVAKGIASKLADFSCTVARKVGENDKIFGSVSVADVADAFKKGGFDVSRRQITLDRPIKSLGVHTATVRLAPEVETQIKVWVVKEE